MRCPNCGKTFDAGNQCPHCNIDAVLFRGTEHLSDRLYNKGLSRLHSMDFTLGIQELRRSVSVNKHNIRTRNLLGLALFEIGHVGEAIKHWLISQSHSKENNIANHYMDKLNDNTRTFERLNEAVVLYNRALDYVRQNSDDLAVIQLKKALEYNPRFVDALNLLTLCYLQQRNRQSANATMERVFAIDVRNPVALRYYSLLNPNRTRPEPRSRVNTTQKNQHDKTSNSKATDTGPFKSVTIREKRTSQFSVVGILAFLIGAACALGVGYYLAVPTMRRDHNRNIQTLQRQIETAETAHENELTTYRERETQLQDKISEHQDELETWQAQYNRKNHTIDVYVANERFRAGGIDNLLAAVNLLEITPLDGLSFDIIAIATYIIETASPLLANHYVTEGTSGFNGGDHDYALVQFENAWRFIAPDSPHFSSVLYHLGTLYYNIPGRESDALQFLVPLTELDGYATFPAPWNARRPRVQTMLGNLGHTPD